MEFYLDDASHGDVYCYDDLLFFARRAGPGDLPPARPLRECLSPRNRLPVAGTG